MTTTQTPNLGLTKAVKGTAEPFSIDSINGNLDILDEAVGELNESVSKKANGLLNPFTGDLNDLVEPGIYARNGDSASNTPSGSDWAGAVLVMSYGTDLYRVFQLDMSCGDNNSAPILFVRHSYHSSGARAWSAWSRLL